MKEDANKTHKNINKTEQLKQQFKAQNFRMQSVEMDNLHLTKTLHKSLEEIRILAKERDELRKIKESQNGKRPVQRNLKRNDRVSSESSLI